MPFSLPDADSIRWWWCAAGDRNADAGSSEAGGGPGASGDGDVEPREEGHMAGW
uniref:Uncharacterized protein n=1 Tax=Arundo donax TaxID=35708 RepID=A0A0A9EN42_ARUDO